MAELFGRRANLVLLGAGDRVLAMAAAPPARAGEAAAEGRRPGSRRARGVLPQTPGPLESFAVPSEHPPGKVKDRAPLSRRSRRRSAATRIRRGARMRAAS